jgi:hypothetical protein
VDAPVDVGASTAKQEPIPPTPPAAAPIAPLPAATAATKTKARLRPVGRQGRATPASDTKGQPATADSRLGAWDPDSPVPP